MAEIAGGAVAFEAATTVLEGAAAAGVALAQSTQPLHGTFSRFAVTPDGDGPSSLARSKHTATVLHGKLYIMGGESSTGKPATNEIHILSLPDIVDSPVDYQCLPAVPEKDGDEVPLALVDHEACAIGDSLFFFNGLNSDGEENLRIWEFRTTTARWRETSLAENAELARRIASGDRSPLPKSDRLLIASTREATYVLDQTSDHVDTLYHLDKEIEDGIFRMIRFPSVVQAGEKQLLPRSRQGAKILPVSLGHGRKYLLLLPGESAMSMASSEAQLISDIWALQLPSSSGSASKIKDHARDIIHSTNVPGSQVVLGGDSGQFSWDQVEIEARNEEIGSEGKSLPGPIAWYGADVIDESDVVLWGGVDAKGGRSGEGWILKVK